MSAQPEFSRPVRIDTLGSAPRVIEIEADASERAALAERFGLVTIDGLAAEVTLTRNDETVTAKGNLTAAVRQSCVATGEPVPAALAETFDIVFRPAPAATGRDEEVELSEEDCDIVFYDGAAVDIGEAIAETLSLSLDPWPRSPNADAALKAEGVRTQDEAEAEQAQAKAANSPFAALKGK